MATLWQTPNQLRSLLTELVGWKSVSLTEGERQFPVKLQAKLQDLEYYQANPDYIRLYDADKRRKFLTALYKHPNATDTICMISHFDTVGTEEYGDFEALATLPEDLTKTWMEAQAKLPPEVLEDLISGEYLFGRGVMDMKMGLVYHMSLIERASMEDWPINLLLVTVPDEEVNSAGMRAAIPKILAMQEEHKLRVTLFLNSEPVFSNNPSNHHYFIYTGSIGKILGAALFYGKETHAGEPLRGLTSSYMASYLTKEMEWNEAFIEEVLGEKTPLPITLQQRDLSLTYSTQTPYRSSALYNIFMMKRSASEVFDIFEKVANEAARKCNEDYQLKCKAYEVTPIGNVKVLKYKDLLEYATNKLGNDAIQEMKADIYYQEQWDDREKALRIADRLMIHCQELAPAIIILFAPPYYPAVNSSDNDLVKECTAFVSKTAQEKCKLSIRQVHYFNGICDLSYVNYEGTKDGWSAFEENTPVWNDTYTIPFKEMQQLQAPVLNVGPFGKDPHKRSERLHIKSAFEQTPVLLAELIKMLINRKSD
ncbi:M20/M25/M40 family metallo-hydrolase [Oceanobacillus piezotolerans]|uniref:M20/M25/M40 family metallo-hydrolase n=1 Tax=Oceanobacillus piezotolerans TaxID=2448030 RepID=A0A498D600_9BACI|nr:M20/M25/M40 family metallo-hydrolase [Oceanobacillus piezotolerans]RLL45138.1 M20/M25/M40 family metallo-hydrolase [Oceanobacillus piezotolerans]